MIFQPSDVDTTSIDSIVGGIDVGQIAVALFEQAALNAVNEWEYTPTQLNGRPTPVIMTVTVQFSLK